MERLLDVKEVADTLQLTENTVRQYIREQKLAAVKFGQVYRVTRSCLKEFVDNHLTFSPKPACRHVLEMLGPYGSWVAAVILNYGTDWVELPALADECFKVMPVEKFVGSIGYMVKHGLIEEVENGFVTSVLRGQLMAGRV